MIITYNHQDTVLYMHKLGSIETSLSSPSVQLGLHVVLPEDLCSSGNHPLSRGGVRRFGECSLVQCAASRLYGGRAAGWKFHDNQPCIQIMTRFDEQYTIPSISFSKKLAVV